MAFPPYGTIVPSLLTWQMAYQGYVLGVPAAYGITQVDGLDLPTVQTADQQRSRDMGEFPGLDVLGGRDISITGDFVASGDLSMPQTSMLLADVASNYTQGGITEFPLWFQWPDLPILCSMSRVRKRQVSVDLSYTMGLANYNLQFHSTDPRLYGAPVQTTVTGVGSSGGGSTISINYPGNVDMRPIIQLNGPLNNPTVSNTNWGIYIALNLTSSEYVVIDLDLHTVQYYNGSVLQYYRAAAASTSVWPSYTNGINALYYATEPTVITCISTDGSPPAGSSMTVTYAPAYLI